MRDKNCNNMDWPATMRGIYASRDVFSPGCYNIQCDLKQGYNNIGLRGSKPALIELYQGERRISHPKFAYAKYGCSPSKCLGTCSKSRLSFRWRRMVFRKSASMFGCKLSGNSLALLVDIMIRGFRCDGLEVAGWVDDFNFSIPAPHPHHIDVSACLGRPACSYSLQAFTQACCTGF